MFLKSRVHCGETSGKYSLRRSTHTHALYSQTATP